MQLAAHAPFRAPSRTHVRFAVTYAVQSVNEKPKSKTMSKPPAFPLDPNRRTFHVVITTYGSRLQGSERGSHRHGTGAVIPSEGLELFHRRLMKEPEVAFHNESVRDAVHNSIMSACAQRDWIVSALNVRTNHVHILLTVFEQEDVSDAVCVIKSAVVAALQIYPEFRDRRIWTEGASVNWIRSARYFQYAYRYVMNQ